MFTESAFLERNIAEHPFTQEEIVDIFLNTPTETILKASRVYTTRHSPRNFDICTVIIAKSGNCTEDCQWCAQSRHFKTNVKVFPITDISRSQRAVERARLQGIGHFAFVTSGRKLSRREVREVTPLIRSAAEHPNFDVCASFGLMQEKELASLKEAGLRRLHCNLETGPDFFQKVCTTHTQEEKVKTIRAAQHLGLEVCSGGLFGIGESFEDRIALAFLLRSLGIRSIPMNFLSPVPGTPLGNMPFLSEKEILLTVALFRFVNPSAYLRFAGGLSKMSESTIKKAMQIGINSAIVGDFATTKGGAVENIRSEALKAGYSLQPSR